jgi:putative tryptophan/tyrosine transport system substrate-binding protein
VASARREGLRDEKRPLGVKLQMVEIRGANEFDTALKTMSRELSGAVLVLADPLTFAHRSQLADLAIRHHLPMMGGVRGYTEAGGLMSYWADQTELYRRAATYVDRILKGATPADLPVEQPTKFELVINLKTAKALGLTIPPSLLARADRVIE